MKIHEIILWTSLRLEKILYAKNPHKTLEQAKRARYMRQDYRKKVKNINCILTPAQYTLLTQQAKAIQMTPTATLRASALAYMKQNYLVPKNTEEQLSQLIFLLRNISNNINQIARKANYLQRISFADLGHAKTTIQQMEKWIIHIIKNPDNHAHQIHEPQRL